MAFQQGLSGLASASKALDVVSNNVANANTVGFKTGAAQFADVFASSLSGASGGTQVGIGTRIAKVAQSFTQGNITVTNNPLDMAISGDGFFRLVSPDGTGAPVYSRNGQFNVDRDGYVVNAQGFRLTGFGISETGQAGTIGELNLGAGAALGEPKMTTEASWTLNLDSRMDAPSPVGGSIDEVDLDAEPPVPLKATMYNSTTTTNIYDSLGNAHTLALYFVQDDAAGQWKVYRSVDGATPESAGTLSFTASGRLENEATDADVGVFDLSLDFSDSGAQADQAVRLNFRGSSQYGDAFGVNSIGQDGYRPGELSGISVSKDGLIRASYSNGESRDLGQVALASFDNRNGLQPLGGNLWAATRDSGDERIGAPGDTNLGLLTPGAVEESNVDLTSELVQLIVQQRAYQANAQSVQAQNTILQTLVNLG
ncbi:flagellar hook protein FlgE [Azoarcus sp. PA01]|nr:flagellar hook protein FlgE [Azoarcus sp. PA01]